MLYVQTLFAVSQAETRAMGTNALREAFHFGAMFHPGEMRLLYTHYDRMIVGGIFPDDADLVLDAVPEAGTASLLDRREMGVLNIGGTAVVAASGAEHALNRGDIFYLGRGSGPVSFGRGGRYYIVSTPAHRDIPARIVTPDQAAKVELGSADQANERVINQFIHPQVMESCQLVMGYTQLATGSVWNTMPAHVHDRRMEAYFYFDMDDDARAFHFMGEPQETRHIVMQNEEAVISPPWSIHCGCGTGSYTFCWAMAGDNVDYTDIDPVSMEDLR